ncbi:Acidic mammalian chitinase-like 4 [Homarus americanus]|uniref:Acidic mammalian chitinase-like 4 n=1 Tax=Homarus americanus TaxID=6706 RepID=A0A8J5N5P1_HOMAM|nr:Acidic mammalian chitinase-like 4 [Homarus americanus]
MRACEKFEKMHQVGYYAIPRESCGDPTIQALTVDNIDPFLCTHINVAFARVVNDDIVPTDESDLMVYREVIALKKKNPRLKVLLSLGGATDEPGFSDLVRDPAAVAQFCTKARKLLTSYGFDGLDLDWEFPAWPVFRHDCREKRWFTQLVQQLHNEFKLASSTPLLLTIAVAGPKSIIDHSYEVNQLAKYVDFVSLMSYDFHMFWPYLPFTGHNAPLAKRKSEKFCFATLNTEWSANYWVKKGMPKEKLVIGVPTYGRSWKLLNGAWYGVASPATGSGIMGGALSYTNEGARRYFDESSKVPYAVRDKDWISYDDPESVKLKAEWIKKMDFAGVMTWNLNCDDWAGVCSGHKFELHNIIKNVLFGNESTEDKSFVSVQL